MFSILLEKCKETKEVVCSKVLSSDLRNNPFGERDAKANPNANRQRSFAILLYKGEGQNGKAS